MKFIYLASPYSHEDPAVMQQRYEAVLHVLMLPGAMLSKGVNREIQFAIQLDIPIRYVHEEENL